MPHNKTQYSRLGIGTAQFGFDYGIANQGGRVAPREIEQILRLAQEYEIDLLDTGAMYGKSERVLGQILPEGHKFKIVTKSAAFDKDRISSEDCERLLETFHLSLENLKADSVYGFLIHHADDLLRPGGENLFEAMNELRSSGLVKRIGVSVYTSNQIGAFLEKFKFDLIQLPINVFDQRLLREGHLDRLKSRGVEIHARSVYLQGLLLMPPDDLPPYLADARPYLNSLHEMCNRAGCDAKTLALNFVKQMDAIDRVVIGIDNSAQLMENISAWGKSVEFDFEELAVEDERIITPGLWKKTACRN